MKKKHLFLFSGFSLFVILSIYGISWIFNNREYCSVEQLLLRESEYPQNTIFDIALSPIDEKPKESISRSSYYNESWIGEVVIKYKSINKAYEIFVDHQSSIFDPSKVYDVWKTPLRLGEDKISADQYKSGCGDTKYFGNRCIFLGRYGEYIVIFNVDIYSNGITQELFRDLVVKIDEEMSACLSR